MGAPGETASRSTTVLDAERRTDLALDDYLDELDRRLDAGWGGFTGTLEQLPPTEPEGVAEQYVMQPFNRLLYLERHWLTVPFELGNDEIANSEQHELRIATLMFLHTTEVLPRTPTVGCCDGLVALLDC